MSKRAGGGNVTVTRALCVGYLYKMREGIKTYEPEVEASKSDKQLQSNGHSKFACFHIHFLLPVSGAAVYLMSRRRLLMEILCCG